MLGSSPETTRGGRLGTRRATGSMRGWNCLKNKILISVQQSILTNFGDYFILKYINNIINCFVDTSNPVLNHSGGLFVLFFPRRYNSSLQHFLQSTAVSDSKYTNTHSHLHSVVPLLLFYTSSEQPHELSFFNPYGDEELISS